MYLTLPTGFPGFEKLEPGDTKEVLVKIKCLPAEADEDEMDYKILSVEGVPVGDMEPEDDESEEDMAEDDGMEDAGDGEDKFLGLLLKPNRRKRKDKEMASESSGPNEFSL